MKTLSGRDYSDPSERGGMGGVISSVYAMCQGAKVGSVPVRETEVDQPGYGVESNAESMWG